MRSASQVSAAITPAGASDAVGWRGQRPAVSLVMPFAGDAVAAASALDALAATELRPGNTQPAEMDDTQRELFDALDLAELAPAV